MPKIISNNDQSTKQVDGVFETYYRAARWVSTNVEVKTSLYVYFVDFFAYFVLQTVRSLNHTVLGGLATEFLWQVQNTVTAALQRLVPDGPPPLLPHNPAATTPTIITIDDSPTDVAGDDAPAVSTPALPQLPATAVSARPKAELVQTILVGSATLRMLSKSAQQMQEKAAEKKGKGKQKGNGGGSSSVFGIDNLCKYHIHTRHTKAAECAEAFVRRTGGKGVWVCGLVMRDVGE
ncbi:hypothetical protein SLS56_004762 [Neofusicoccum ribis]|uniref:Uncharacterized protein n=1 Tax=Neofusicoccum ribis TaxID=45134 RepID=A0ABR3SVJ4_9PEZI